MDKIRSTKEERKLALFNEIFETVVKDPNDKVPALTERHHRLFEERQAVVAPSQAEALEGLKLFLEHKLDKKFYSNTYSPKHGGNEQDIVPDEGNGRYTVNGTARLMYEYKGWEYIAEDVAFSRTYNFKSLGIQAVSQDPGDEHSEATLESAQWTDNVLYLSPTPLDRTKESNIENYELSREALGPIGALLSQYFAK